MTRLIHRALATGRIGRKRSFVVALILAAMVLPVTTALAYFTATGTGTFANVQAVSTGASVVSITQQAGQPYVYKDSTGATVTSLMLGGQVLIPTDVTCTAGAPCQVGTVVLQSWTSDKAGCDTTTLPGSFTASSPPAFNNVSIATVGAKISSNYGISWNNLGSSQAACLGAKFSFVLAAA